MVLQYLVRFLLLIPTIAILVASIIILVKTRSAGGILLIIGESISIVMQIFWIVYPIILNYMSLSFTSGPGNVLMIGAQIISFIGISIFATGLFLLAYNNLVKKK